MQNTVSTHLILRDRNQRFGIALNRETGLLAALLYKQGDAEHSLPLMIEAELILGGREIAGIPSGLKYVDTERLTAFERVDIEPTHSSEGPQETYTVSTQVGEWSVVWHYTFRQRHPRIEMAFEISLLPTVKAAALLRDVHLNFSFSPPDLSSWLVEAPGNTLRSGVTANALQEAVDISSVGGVQGSTGTIVLHHPEQRQLLVIWPFSRTEIGTLTLQTHTEHLHFNVDTGLAGKVAPGESLRYNMIELDALTNSWAEVRDQFPTWYGPIGLSTPLDRVEWIKNASIFEVQIGYSIFWGEYKYEPYPTIRALIADLGRIKGLGYTMLQIMPRQPYPSYNIHDYADITTSYGDEADLRALVQAAHALGMHVILDILLHGVIDQEVITETARRVRSGPYFERLAERTDTMFTPESSAISWSRHILDFERYWAGGSPFRHSLADEHPEWFMRDSDQNIIGIYTKAFDVANTAWQDYFSDAAVHLVKELDIDGFRFDAPTYNDLPNWSTSTAGRASYSPMGCLELFDKLRVRLKETKESLILYTEPSGVAFRQSMDVTYNYEEQWLFNSIFRPQMDEQSERTRVRNGRELAAWFRDRNAMLPAGSLIAHHIDSHDTFWWPLPGEKWRREQFGVPATRALLAIFSLSGGTYMTFVGGEKEIEDDVRRAHRLRQALPEVGLGQANYGAVEVDQETIYAVLRTSEQSCSVLLVNLSDQPCEALCSIDLAQLPLSDTLYSIYDAWSDQALDVDHRYALPREELHQLRLPFAAFQTRLITFRPAA